ncbi:phosphoribosylaminoimidazolesuccinocarboxamide synthase [Lentibacillus sp. CBA3610]|uniref:phosphoribosylaminoimidazolesuccinocarboxamide synthase n=1 Tax=Lentibacillus sp. CBA3610 TaxID=2518176 RepID=UPI0015982B5B|nr:phosphoribosylaminoimidazolesuccinocarboxamide synthase [Lentibacillus sp. CBA3610]QKY71463.1 phosphoribosylaminoimidazolesuccinocarboxamide synthase [Lentibacillus sp. CBA3610]
MKADLLYEGKAKRVYQATDNTGHLVLEYKNDATAFNGGKKEIFTGKGRLNNEISAYIFNVLNEQGIQTHFVEKLSENEQLVHQTEVIPLEVVVRNVAAGSITRRLGIGADTPFNPPLVELFYKDDDLGDPLINDEHALFLSDINKSELQEIKTKALEINQQLRKIFEAINLKLVDFKLEFGRLASGCIVLSDEISPDTCRLWDITTNENLDKDVFREGNGDLLEVYQKLLNRLEARS